MLCLDFWIVRVRYNADFVKSRFCSVHFIVILAELKKAVRYTENLAI